MAKKNEEAQVCGACNGSGACDTCGGTGELWIGATPGHPARVDLCYTCHGTGNCQRCGGTGAAK